MFSLPTQIQARQTSSNDEQYQRKRQRDFAQLEAMERQITNIFSPMYDILPAAQGEFSIENIEPAQQDSV